MGCPYWSGASLLVDDELVDGLYWLGTSLLVDELVEDVVDTYWTGNGLLEDEIEVMEAEMDELELVVVPGYCSGTPLLEELEVMVLDIDELDDTELDLVGLASTELDIVELELEDMTIILLLVDPYCAGTSEEDTELEDTEYIDGVTGTPAPLTARFVID